MYNEEKKRQFIETITENPSYIASLISVFNKAEPVEEKFGKDISEFDKREFEVYFNTLDITKTRSVSAQKSIISRYCKWTDGKIRPYFSDIEIDYSMSIEAKTVYTPQELKDYLDFVFDDPYNEMIYVVYKSIMWLLYMGVEWDDVDKVRIEDVDLDNGVVHYKGEDLHIYPEAFELFKACKERDTFLIAANRVAVYNEKERINSDFFIRGCTARATKKGYQTTIRRHMNRANVQEVYGKVLNVTGVFYSGNFYRAFHMFREYEDQEEYLFRKILGGDTSTLGDIENRRQKNTMYNKRVYLRKDFKAWRNNYIRTYGYPDYK